MAGAQSRASAASNEGGIREEEGGTHEEQDIGGGDAAPTATKPRPLAAPEQGREGQPIVIHDDDDDDDTKGDTNDPLLGLEATDYPLSVWHKVHMGC
eukprot:jgi/Tetstr1/428581/TSEL_018574.t1